MTTRRAVFRVDAAPEMGTGHLMRCRALGLELKKRGFEVTFVSRDLSKALSEIVTKDGFELVSLVGAKFEWAEDARQTREAVEKLGDVEWLIVDHYGIDRRWETELMTSVDRVAAIDDLADRDHQADVVLDQNFYKDFLQRYRGRTTPGCRLLLGPRYALLRSEFAAARANAKPRTSARKLHVFLGGVDNGERTLKALKAIHVSGLSFPGGIDVIVGPANPGLKVIERACADLRGARVHVNPPNLAELEVQADLAFGTCGSAIWERLCLGLPSVVVTVAKNQLEAANFLQEQGYVEYAGDLDSLSLDKLAQSLGKLARDGERLESISRKGMDLVDGQGASRVADALEKELAR